MPQRAATSRLAIANNGIPCFIDAEHAIAHNKAMVIDGKTVTMGSFNSTKAVEENNAEDLLVIQDAEMAGKYSVYWQTHREHLEPYAGIPGNAQSEPQARRKSRRITGRRTACSSQTTKYASSFCPK